MAAKRYFVHFCHVFLLFGAIKAILSIFVMVLCLLLLKIANSAKMLTSPKKKKMLTSANFFIMYFYVSGHFEYFYFC